MILQFFPGEYSIMLLLSRRVGETVMIGEDPVVEVTVISIHGNQVKIGISAPKNVLVDRAEIRRMKKSIWREK